MNTKVLNSHATHSFPNLQWLKILLKQWKRNISTRHKLLEMDDGRLSDIGIDRKTAIMEAHKPFWR